MKPLSLILAAASSIAVVATTPALAGHGGVSEREMVTKFVRIFDRLDRNGNGKLSRKGLRRLEHRSAGHRGGHNNGPRVRVVFGDENFRIAFGTRGGRHGGGSSYIGPINSRTFHLYDLNRDGRIHRRELRHAVRDEFARADRNGDGYLNQRELNRSNWYRNSHARTHVRYYPDYRHDARRKGHRAGHNDHRHRDGHRADKHRGGHRDGHHADRHRRDDHKADRHHRGRKDGHRNRHRDGHRDRHRADRARDDHRDRDAHRADETSHRGDRDTHHDRKKRKARDKRDRDRDDDRRRHKRDDA